MADNIRLCLRQYTAVRPAAYLNSETFIEFFVFGKSLAFFIAILPKQSKRKDDLQMKECYKSEISELYEVYESSSCGLSDSGIEKNRKKYGENKLEEKKKKPVWKIFLEQFKDLLVIILIIAAIVSAFTKDIESCIVILFVITMNSVLGTVQTVKAEKSLNSLKKLATAEVTVIRNGRKTSISAEDLVCGDIMCFEAGDKICADGRITECADLMVNESALTGESTEVEKSDCVIMNDCQPADRVNMVYSGSFVTGGRACAIVTQTGMDTEVGKIASLISNASERRTPLQKVLDDLGKKLSVIIMVISATVFLLSVIKGSDIFSSLMFAIALAVAAIPEALGSIVTIVLSFGTQKMSKENAIVKKLYAVEGLGSISVICSDKTGTITQNKMSVRSIYTNDTVISREDFSAHNPDLIDAMVLCNNGAYSKSEQIGDPTETALLEFAASKGYDIDKIKAENKRLSEVPFSSGRKRMSVLCGNTMYTKGAVDMLISRFTLTDDEKKKLLDTADSMAKNGFRTLAFAKKTNTSGSISAEDENNLEFIGLVAMMDPPREEAKDAVKKCKSAGIMPVMITGDHISTASAIAKEVGILSDGLRAVEGKELDKLSDEKLKDFVRDVAVYARVTPEHKIRIVKAWQANGLNVAMTGDGVNDAPALKQADIGVAMGITGTEVSKEAAGIILTDDNFATIVKAVRSGRNIYENIKKAVLFLLSGNFAAIIAVLYNLLFALPVPFAPIHLLFINLLTDSLPAIALGVEKYTDDVMYEKPRKSSDSFINKSFIREMFGYGTIISVFVITAFYIGLKTNAEAAATMAFTTLCAARLFHGFSCKRKKPVLFTKRMFDNPAGIGAFLIGMTLLCLVNFVPALKGMFKTYALSGAEYIWVLCLSFGSMLAIQLVKLIRMIIKK